jgi:hypothetical protein
VAARFDHLVVAVEDLDDATARWTAAGLRAARGGAHPVGTVNALVRGPGPAYVELIAPGSDESNPWLDRVRSARGPISWAIAVDDIEAARTTLLAAGFEPDPAVPGSRRTPDGDVVDWKVCDVGPGPYDGSLPFLIEWTTPMGTGPADGPVVEWFEITPPEPERLADLLLALGFAGRRHWPRRSFEQPDGPGITIHPVGEADDADGSSWSMSWDETGGPLVSLVLAIPGGEITRTTLDGVCVVTRPDRRRFAASALQPTGGSGSAPDRAEAWVESLVSSGLAVAEEVEVVWAAGIAVDVTGATRLSGPAGTQPITVVRGVHPLDRTDVVVIGVGDPVEVLERQPTVGSDPTAEQVDLIDDAFVLALSGGVYAVRRRRRSVTRHLDGWGSNGRFADGEAVQWLEQAAAGRRTDGVVAGDPWLS